MHRRTLLLAPFLAPLLAPEVIAPASAQVPAQRSAPLTAQDQADIARIETYLNGVRTLHSRFLQVAPDGRTSEGQAWLQRPGRMRFQYDPPSPFLLVGGHGLLIFHDAQLKQTSNIPLGQTPLGLLLQENLRLSGDITVAGLTRMPGQLQVTLYRTRSPQDGQITLVFADAPLTLRQWVVLDAQRQATRVTLYNVELGSSFDQKLFEFVDPRFFQNNTGGGG
ncbi:MAG: outer membrane lipoprotein carrier protein LolA [Acetobacteraceae bacterium]